MDSLLEGQSVVSFRAPSAVTGGEESAGVGPSAPSAPPRIAFLKAITVEGFRGIGPKATLDLTPGPGLTLVVGRNGSGKSSFAEGLELLLTGDTYRWRNLHHPKAALAVDAPSAESPTPSTPPGTSGKLRKPKPSARLPGKPPKREPH